MAVEWKPLRDINNNGFRPMKFTATAAAITKGTLCKFTGSGAATVEKLGANTIGCAGVAMHAIDASSTEAWLYTDGIFYCATGAGGACALNHWVMFVDTTNIQVVTATAGLAIVGVALVAATSDNDPMEMLLCSTVTRGDAFLMAA